MKKVRIMQEGKSFEAYVQMLMLDGSTIIGLGIAGNITACRAIHASLYNAIGYSIIIEDEENDCRNHYRTSASFRRLEVLNGKVCHAFFLPRTAMQEDFETALQRVEQNEEAVNKPDRIIIAKEDEIESDIGQFLANVYGLPRSKEWADCYFTLLPRNKWEEIDIETTELMDDDFKHMRAIKLIGMLESEMLEFIEIGISSNVLSPTTDLGSQATFEENMTTEEYLRTNAESLAFHIDKHLKPRYDGLTLNREVGETKRVSLPAQARATMGILETLKHENSAFVVGDMGSGKSQISLTTVQSIVKQRERSGARDGLRVLIVAPAITIPKWATSEIPTVLGAKHIKTIMLESTEDALKYVRKVKSGYKPPKGTIEFVLVSTDRMKLGASGYVLGARWDYKEQIWSCPDCGNPIISPSATKDEPDLLASWDDAVLSPVFPPSLMELEEARGDKTLGANGVPNGYIKKWSTKIRRFECKACSLSEHTNDDMDNQNESECKIIQSNHSLVRPALKSRGETKMKPRWMIAQIFQRNLKGHFHVGIYDEIQMMKASDSGRGLSFHKLLKTTRKNMFLTGTLTNGEATSIQSTLWRSDPKSLLDDGFTHQSSDIAWSKRYGVLEKVTHRRDDGVVGITTNRRKERVILKTKPGISPKLTANHLLHKSVFLDLSDLGLPLVKKEEIPMIIPLDDEHKVAYSSFERELHDACKEMQKEMGTGAWAKYNPTTLNYADQPHIEPNVEFIKDGEWLGDVTAPTFDRKYLNAKERELVKVVKENLEENRGCIIYNNFTGKYNQNERLKEVLKQHGIKAEILDTKVSSLKRFEWLDRQKNKGTKVLILNMSLVQVGLDLLEWPSIIYYQLNDDINTLRQAGGRNWRIGQNRNCRIYYLINEETQQMRQFERLMTRRIEALLVEGRIQRSDPLVKFAKENESKLARDLSYSLEASELVERWKTTAEKDVDQNIEMVDEVELKERLDEAFKTLTDETKKMCGVPLIEPKDNVVEFPLMVDNEGEDISSPVQLDIFEIDTSLFTVDEIPSKSKEGTPTQQIALNL